MGLRKAGEKLPTKSPKRGKTAGFLLEVRQREAAIAEPTQKKQARIWGFFISPQFQDSAKRGKKGANGPQKSPPQRAETFLVVVGFDGEPKVPAGDSSERRGKKKTTQILGFLRQFLDPPPHSIPSPPLGSAACERSGNGGRRPPKTPPKCPQTAPPKKKRAQRGFRTEETAQKCRFYPKIHGRDKKLLPCPPPFP